MPFSNEARKNAAVGHAIKVYLGPRAYDEFKRTKVVPIGLLNAARAKVHKKKGAKLSVGPGDAGIVTPDGSSQLSGAAQGTLVGAARKVGFNDIIAPDGTLFHPALDHAFPALPGFSESERHAAAATTLALARHSKSPEGTFRSFQSAFLAGKKSFVSKLRKAQKSTSDPEPAAFIARALRVLGSKAA